MSYIGQAPGLGQRVIYRFVATANQTLFSGLDVNGFPLSYVPGFVDFYRNGRFIESVDVVATDGSTFTLPSGLQTDDQIKVVAQAPFSPANTWTQAQADTLYHRRRNRLIDPGMRVSQEQGNTLITMASGVVYYPCDGVACVRSGATGGVQVQRVQSITPNGSGNRLRFTVTAANPTPAASDYLIACFPVEGQEITDLRFGSAGAKLTLYRVTLRMPVACKLSFGIRNSALTRSYVGTLEILPGEVGLDVTKYILVPGDTTGSWNIDNSLGATLMIGFTAGSTYQGAPGWQAGNMLGLAANSNLMMTTGWSFDVMDYGWTDASDITNPTPPRFELPAITADIEACQRYYVSRNYLMGGYGGANTTDYATWVFDKPMRIDPNVYIAGANTGNMYPMTINNKDGGRVSFQSTYVGTGGGYSQALIVVNARMI